MPLSETLLEQVYRQERGQILAALVAWSGDFDLAEEALQDAFVAAVEHWADAVPQRPGAWLMTTARRKAIDRVRRRKPQLDVQELDALAWHEDPELLDLDELPDERLKLLFTCCHPALPLEQQIALTLHTLGGLTTAEIAAAFLLPVPTMAQRLVRAKRKIKVAGIPYIIPAAQVLSERLQGVLAVIYLIFTEGYAATSGDALLRVDLCNEALRLCRVLERLIRQQTTDISLGQHAEVLGLLALMLLTHARHRARIGPEGELILLEDQDRSLWNSKAIQEGCLLLEKALHMRHGGPYQIQAAISALHARAAHVEETDWRQIVGLYTELRRYQDSPIVQLNQAVARGMAVSPQAAIAQLVPLSASLSDYAPFHLALADMHERAGNTAQALQSYQQALALTQNSVESASIQRRIDRVQSK